MALGRATEQPLEKVKEVVTAWAIDAGKAKGKTVRPFDDQCINWRRMVAENVKSAAKTSKTTSAKNEVSKFQSIFTYRHPLPSCYCRLIVSLRQYQLLPETAC